MSGNRVITVVFVLGNGLALWIAWHGGWTIFLLVLGAIEAGLALGKHLTTRTERP